MLHVPDVGWLAIECRARSSMTEKAMLEFDIKSNNRLDSVSGIGSCSK